MEITNIFRNLQQSCYLLYILTLRVSLVKVSIDIYICVLQEKLEGVGPPVGCGRVTVNN